MSGRRPTPRHAKKGPSRLVVALVSVLLIVLVGLWAWWAYSETARADEANAEKKEERDMWITMSRKEAAVNYLKCMGTGALCMGILLFLMLR